MPGRLRGRPIRVNTCATGRPPLAMDVQVACRAICRPAPPRSSWPARRAAVRSVSEPRRHRSATARAPRISVVSKVSRSMRSAISPASASGLARRASTSRRLPAQPRGKLELLAGIAADAGNDLRTLGVHVVEQALHQHRPDGPAPDRPAGRRQTHGFALRASASGTRRAAIPRTSAAISLSFDQFFGRGRQFRPVPDLAKRQFRHFALDAGPVRIVSAAATHRVAKTSKRLSRSERVTVFRQKPATQQAAGEAWASTQVA